MTVALIEDDAAVLHSLRLLLESRGLAVRCFDSAEPFLAAMAEWLPSCVVTDVRMPGLSGLDLQRELKRRGLGIPVILITGHGDIEMAVTAIKEGAFDFIEKPFSDQTLLDRIRAAVAHDEVVRRRRATRAEVQQRLALLTTRERDVLNRVVTGKSNKVIASELILSTKTVEVHRAHVMEKLKADSLADLIRLALLASEEGDDDAPTAS